MLWTDSIFISTADLTRIDTEVPTIAVTEGVTLDGDNGLIKGAIEEAAQEIQKWVIAFGGYLNAGDLSANHLAAVLNVGIGNSVRQKIVLSQVCVSGDTANSFSYIKQWAIFFTLRVFYRGVFTRTINDRYEKKMDLYKSELDRRVSATVKALGIPVVLRPLFAPASYFTRNSGTWDSTNVSVVVGPGTSAVSYDVAVSYMDMSQSNLYVSPAVPNNAESNISPIITQAVTSGHVIEVDTTSLIPPTGIQDPAQVLVSVMSPLMATHWNVYVGLTGKTLYLQNLSPIPVATKTFTLPNDPLLSGYYSLLGQYSDRRLSLTPTRQRS